MRELLLSFALILALTLLAAGKADATITLVQHTSNFNGSGASVAKAYASNVTNGNFLLAGCSIWNATGDPTVADTLVNAWTKIDSTGANGSTVNHLTWFYTLIDPEVLLRLLLVGYLYGITSERRLLEEVRMHLAYRWFARLDFDPEIPDHSTFSKNRHGRFRPSGVFRQVFEEIVRCCLAAGLVEGENLAVDGTMVEANASRQSRAPRQRLGDAAQVSRTVEEYLVELEKENTYYCPEGKPLHHRGQRRSSQGDLYRSTEAQCPSCSQEKLCTAGPYRRLFVHWQEPARRVVRALADTPDYKRS